MEAKKGRTAITRRYTGGPAAWFRAAITASSCPDGSWSRSSAIGLSRLETLCCSAILVDAREGKADNCVAFEPDARKGMVMANLEARKRLR